MNSTNPYVAAAMVTALLFQTGRLHAQEVQAVPSGQDQIVPMRKGDPSTFDGQLFSNDTAVRWANWLVQYKNLVKTNKDLQQRLCAADMEAVQTRIALQKEQYVRVNDELQKKVEKLETDAANTPWYKTVTFGVVLGVTGTVVLVAGSAALIGAASK